MTTEPPNQGLLPLFINKAIRSWHYCWYFGEYDRIRHSMQQLKITFPPLIPSSCIMLPLLHALATTWNYLHVLVCCSVESLALQIKSSRRVWFLSVFSVTELSQHLEQCLAQSRHPGNISGMNGMDSPQLSAPHLCSRQASTHDHFSEPFWPISLSLCTPGDRSTHIPQPHDIIADWNCGGLLP